MDEGTLATAFPYTARKTINRAHPPPEMEDLTPLLYTTKSNLLRQVLDRGGVVLGFRAAGYKGILATDPALTTRLSERIRHTGVEGFISTDELPKYGISIVERDAVERAFHLGGQDTVVMVAGPRAAAERAVRLLEEELSGAPPEPLPAPEPRFRSAPRRSSWPCVEPPPEPDSEAGVTTLRKIHPRRDIDIL